MEYKSQQIETRDLRISHLNEQVEALAHSLHEKETSATYLQLQQVTTTPEQLSKVISLTIQIAELKQRLQEVEYQKQLVVIEREAAIQDMETKQKVELQLYKHLGKLQFADIYMATPCVHLYFVS